MRRIALVVGTRPEAIKIAPVVLALREHPGFEPILIATGQHGALFDEALRPFGLTPDRRLAVATPDDPIAMAASIEAALVMQLRAAAPALVLVQGDTSSALAAARAAASLGIAVGHLEAGLRSHDLDRPWPEEGNRIAIDRISHLLFAPSQGAMANLAADPAITGECFLTGNTGIDALCHIRRAQPPPASAPAGQRRAILVTLHRRETIGAPLRAICGALRRLADRGDVALHLPLHPNQRVRSAIIDALSDHPAISLSAPFGYGEMVARMADACLILSDSGGVQEEAAALGTPLLILRDVTERPEAIACGTALLAGTDPATIWTQATRLLDDDIALGAMAVAAFPYGRGHAAAKTARAIEYHFASRGARDRENVT